MRRSAENRSDRAIGWPALIYIAALAIALAIAISSIWRAVEQTLGQL